MRLRETTIVRDFRRSFHKPVLSTYTPTDAYCEISYQLLQYMFNDACSYHEFDFMHRSEKRPCNLAYGFQACTPYFRTVDFSIVMFNKSTRNPEDFPTEKMRWHIKVEGDLRSALQYFEGAMCAWSGEKITLKLT